MRTAAICPTCATYENALCVLYDGQYLPLIDVAPLDSLQVALEKINSALAGISPFVLEPIIVDYEGTNPQLTLLSIPPQKLSFCGNEIDGGTVWADISFEDRLQNYHHSSGTTSLTFPNLESMRSIYTIDFYNDYLTNLSFPELKIILGYLLISGVMLENLNLDSLVFCDALEVDGADSLTSLNLSSVEYLRSIRVKNSNILENVDLSSLKLLMGGIQFYNNPQLTTITFSEALKEVDISFDGRFCALSESCVDDILVRLASLDGTNDTVSYNNKSVYLDGGTNSTPSAIGLAAKVILESRGCTVTIN